MTTCARQRFLDYVLTHGSTEPVVSPFLPDPGVVRDTLGMLGEPSGADAIGNEIRLSRRLGYEPMFMTDCMGLIFPWREDPDGSDERTALMTLDTRGGTWSRRVSRELGEWGDEEGFPIRAAADHDLFVKACEAVPDRADAMRAYYRGWRERVGDDGVIVIGHPHVSSLAYQISQRNLVYHMIDDPVRYRKSADAVCEAAQFVFGIAIEEGIDFMSESTYGLEMTSPRAFDTWDMPYTARLSTWVHERGGLFWYHNCGFTDGLIASGRMERLGADVIETLASPPEGDNDLARARRTLARSICTKGNLPLGLLRDGTPDEVACATEEMVRSVFGFPHIHSTADAVLPQTPPENFVAFIESARGAHCGRGLLPEGANTG